MSKILAFVVNSVVGYLLGLLVFRLILMKPMDTYASTAMWPLRELPFGIVHNLKQYYKLVLQDFESLWMLLTGVIGVSFIISSVVDTQRNRLVTLLLTGVACVLAGVLAFGAYIALEHPITDCRSMFGFGALIAFLALSAVSEKRALPAKAAAFCLSWCFLVLALSFGNGLAAQKAYVDFRIQLVISDLNDLEVMASEEEVQLQLTGYAGNAPLVNELITDKPIMNRLIKRSVGGDGIFNTFYFYHYFGLGVEQVEGLDQQELPLLKEGRYHNIYGEGNQIRVDLKWR